MSQIIGNSTSDLKEFAEKCSRKGGTTALRTRFLRKLDGKVRVKCYGADLESGVIDGIPEEKVKKLRRSLELKGKNALDVIREL